MARARDLLGRFLQPPPPRERGPPPELPARIGPVELSPFGAKWMAVRCPSDLDPLMRKVGGLWEAGSRRWLIERRRLGPLAGSCGGPPIRCSGVRGWT
jgi:hypothetical protein